MIDFEKYGLEVSDEQVENNEYVQEELSFDSNVEEVVQEQTVVTQEPVSSKRHGQANIVVAGIGGGGNNAVNNMLRSGIKSANFVVMNTDMQALNTSLVSPKCKIQLGVNKTGGLGAGSKPEIGQLSAEESRETIKAALVGIDLLFITAGMGGGTGTGAAPIVAEIAKAMGILTVAVVTKPFNFEGAQRMKNAEEGIRQLKNFVDTLLVIPNQKLIEVLDKNISFKRAFEIADDVLRQGVQGVSDVIANPELINLDFADVRTILSNKGLAHMGIGYGKGEKRVIDAVRAAVCSPLLETDIEGATDIIVNICSGEDMTIGEVEEACNIIKQVIHPNANIIFGTAIVPDKTDIEITIIATGFLDKSAAPARTVGTPPKAITKSVNSITSNESVAPVSQAPVVEFTQDIFANRPRFNNLSPNSEVQTANPVTYDQVPKQNERVQMSQPEPQQREDVASTRVNVNTRQVPAFLRKLRRDRD